MKLMFIDDEPLVLKGLQSLIDWASYGFTIAGESGDGEEGLALLDALRPDIVLLDIRMPGLSGVELMRRARAQGFKGKFILLTGYADFGYAQEAIRCGATDYLLKPVDEEELLRAVLKAEEELTLGSVLELYGDQTLSQLRASLMEGLLRGRIDCDASRLGLAQGAPFRLLLVRCRAACTAPAMDALRRALGGSVLMANMERCVAVLLAGRAAIAARGRAAEAVRALDADALICLSGTGLAPGEMRQLYSSTLLLMDNAWFYRRPDRAMLDYKEFAPFLEAPPPPPPDADALARDLCRGIDALDVDALQALLDGLLRRLMGRCLDPPAALGLLARLRRALEEHLAAFFPEAAAPAPEPDRAPTLFQAAEAFGAQVLRAAERVRRTGGADVRRRLLAYIENNYQRPLRLRELAHMLGYDSAYLGKLLKRETGLSFNAYLEKIRLEHARCCLKQGLSVSEAAQRCGFGSVEYFSNTFRKAQGCSPSAYRRRCQEP